MHILDVYVSDVYKDYFIILPTLYGQTERQVGKGNYGISYFLLKINRSSESVKV